MRERRWLGRTTVLALLLAFLAAPVRAGEPDDVQKELAELRESTRSSFKAARESIDALKQEVARLRKELEDLHKSQGRTNRAARFGAATGFGTIRLSNAYVEPVRFVVNGIAYWLAPGETRLLRSQAAGPFTYEILGIKPAVQRVLVANETFTIRVYPQ
jgi:hypothetical protein